MQSLYLPGQSVKVPEFLVSQISNGQKMSLGSSSNLKTTRIYPQEKYSWYSYLLETESN